MTAEKKATLEIYDDSTPDYPKWVIDRERSDGTEQLAVVNGEDAEYFARLFHAAPDLLVAAKDVLALLESFAKTLEVAKSEYIDDLRAAIAKAEEG